MIAILQYVCSCETAKNADVSGTECWSFMEKGNNKVYIKKGRHCSTLFL